MITTAPEGNKSASTNFKLFTEKPLRLFRYVGIDLTSTKPSYLSYVIFIISLINLCLWFISQCLFLMYGDDDYTSRTTTIGNATYYFVCILKLCAMVKNRKLFLRTFTQLQQIYPTTSIEQRYKLEKYVHGYIKLQSALYWFILMVMILCNLTPPLVSLYELHSRGFFEHRLFNYMWFPFDFQQISHLLYGLIYLLIAIGSLQLGCVSFCCDQLLFSAVQQLCLQFDYLARRIREIDPRMEGSIDKLKAVVQEHQRLLDLTKDIDSIFTSVILCSLLSSSFFMCFNGYQLLGDTTPDVMGRCVFLIIYELKQSVIICYFGDKLIETSADIFNAVYSHDWIDGSLQYKRLVILILLRSREPCCLSIAGISNISFETLKKVLSISYRTFAVLR